MIDLYDELLGLINKEEMFAFFDFSLRLPEDRTVSGLCEISKPRSTDSKTHYITLMFLIDAVEDILCHTVDDHINRIDWDDLRDSVPVITSILPMPYLSERSGIYAREIDIYLSGDKLTRPFIERFQPLLAETMGLKVEAPVFWDDQPPDGTTRVS